MEVDFSKLTRDYRINPLKRGETIPKEDFVQRIKDEVADQLKEIDK